MNVFSLLKVQRLSGWGKFHEFAAIGFLFSNVEIFHFKL